MDDVPSNVSRQGVAMVFITFFIAAIFIYLIYMHFFGYKKQYPELHEWAKNSKKKSSKRRRAKAAARRGKKWHKNQRKLGGKYDDI